MTASSKSRSYARFIPREEIGRVSVWRFDSVFGSEDPVPVADETPEAPVEESVEVLLAERFDAGVAHGQELARAEFQQQFEEYLQQQVKTQAAQASSLIDALNARLSASEQVMAEGVLDVAMQLARQVIRQELTVNPDVVRTVAEEAVHTLVADGRVTKLRLHPDDLALWGGTMGWEHENVALVSDDSLQRGDVMAECGGAVVDATVSRRWQRAIHVLGKSDPESLEATP